MEATTTNSPYEIGMERAVHEAFVAVADGRDLVEFIKTTLAEVHNRRSNGHRQATDQGYITALYLLRAEVA